MQHHLALLTAALSCPDCPAGQVARQEALGAGLGARLLIAVLPFLAVGLAAILAEQSGRR